MSRIVKGIRLKLDRVSLFVQKFGKPKIFERLNSNTAIQTGSLKVIKFY